ncbi:MAG: TRAP transporter substrate-binding protein [Proteobacteria bacterium]|jgi:tripartite ATP-independent transporter DctP family solute receptor|nr:TRAP transporter substrate-binding protein [Pseudomonadota bacterium]
MKTTARFTLIISIVVSMCLITFAGSALAVKKQGDKVILKLAHVNPPGSPTDMAAKKFVELVAKGTDGKVVIKIFSNEQLGTEKAALESVMLGAIDCSLNDAAYLADLYPPMGVLDFPYTYTGFNHYEKMVLSDVFQELSAAMDKEVGLKVIAPFLFGRRMLCSNKPIYTPADAKGVKIRTPGSELAMENARTLGGVPTTISYTEAYMGLKQGVADAAENPFTGIYDMKWYEVTKYLVVTEHVWNNEMLSISNKAWKAMTADQRKVFAKAGIEAAMYRIIIQKELEDQRVSDLRNLGMHVIYPASLDPFRSIAANIEKKYRDKYKSSDWGTWHDRIIGLAK